MQNLQRCKRCRKSITNRKTSEYCRNCYQYVANKALRLKRKENKICISCGVKIKPKIIYPVRCDRCNERARRLIQKRNK